MVPNLPSVKAMLRLPHDAIDAHLQDATELQKFELFHRVLEYDEHAFPLEIGAYFREDWDVGYDLYFWFVQNSEYHGTSPQELLARNMAGETERMTPAEKATALNRIAKESLEHCYCFLSARGTKPDGMGVFLFVCLYK